MKERDKNMKLSEPDKVAFDYGDYEAMDFWDSRRARSQEFWDKVEEHLEDIIASRKAKAGEEHAFAKKMFLDHIGKYTDALSQGKPFGLPAGFGDERSWNLIKFIIAFDMRFEYYPDMDDLEKEDGEEESRDPETDYLDDESTFQFDIVKECDRLALAGAILAKRIGSDTYGIWRVAMVKLGSLDETVQCKAVDDIVNALELIWADLRTWIAMNPPHNAKKGKPKKRKAKK